MYSTYEGCRFQKVRFLRAFHARVQRGQLERGTYGRYTLDQGDWRGTAVSCALRAVNDLCRAHGILPRHAVHHEQALGSADGAIDCARRRPTSISIPQSR